MRQDDRAPFERALQRARAAAFANGDFAGQESFMTAGEIRALAARAGIGHGVSVLDVGCGVGGPGQLLARETGCGYLGADFSASAVAIARERAPELRFAIAYVPPLPEGPFDVVLLLEAMLAIEDKDALVHAVAEALPPGGRFAFTLEEGEPLTAAERAAMPDPDTVWLTPLASDAGQPGAGRARRHVAGGPEPRAPRDGAGAAGRVRRGRGRRSRRSSAAARWTTCSPRTGSGSTGWTRGGSASSRWWPSGATDPSPYDGAMQWTVYLSGEIHTDWRERIERAAAGLDVGFTAPVTDHAASDAAGTAVLGEQERPFWNDHIGAGVNAIRTRTLIERADVVVVRFGEQYRQWNAAFDAGYAAALGKPLITLHPPEHDHALKEVDRAALAVAREPEQVVEILRYALAGPAD